MIKYKPYEQLELTDDFMFSYVMRSNGELCRQLLESILNFPIERIDFISSQETIDTYASASYIIFLCTFDPFGFGQYIYSFQNRCTELPAIALNDGTYKVFVNTQGTHGVIGDELKEFLLFLKSPDKFQTGANGKLVKKAIVGVEEGRRNEEWRLIYMTLMTKFDELLAEGLQQGLVEGRREGLRQGKLEGMAAGRLEGMAEGEIRFARLTEILLLEGKLDDLQRSVSDTKFREQLYMNYKL